MEVIVPTRMGNTPSSTTSVSPERRISRRLDILHREQEEKRTEALAAKLGLKYLNLRIQPIDRDALRLIPFAGAQKAQAVAIRRYGKALTIALIDPDNAQTKALLESYKQDAWRLTIYLVSPSSLQRALALYRELPKEGTAVITGTVEVAEERVGAFAKEILTLEDFKKHFGDVLGGNTSYILEFMLAGCLQLDASDLHLERGEGESTLRLRLDGLLYDAGLVPLPVAGLLVNRIKLLSQLKLNIAKKPQDGRFSFRSGGNDIEIRTSIIPGEYGEDVVLRILNPKTIALTVEDLGIRKDLYETIVAVLKRPHGMIVTTGPTGSGKTTTLYAFLRKSSSSEVKIITVEDPIEYHIEGIAQTQVNPGRGYSFAAALRSVLRQDPDMILVGEIRDLETAETAFQAALTGHLVFSTLHTNDAVGTIPRLIDLGLKPNVIAPALTLALAQRLLRKLCESCKTTYSPDVKTTALITQALGTLSPAVHAPITGELTLFKPVGCNQCLDGYKGRVGVFEGLLVDETIQTLILQAPPLNVLREAAMKNGMVTLTQDALMKVTDGISTLEEVERVVGLF
ncbi:MAG: GspE/PulE family protein [bacterium]|nr:GspE/PulE family protein [bacterium]MDZ4295963.1 GspE/PulE family protein [Patescibacteria group bacterium]